MKAFLPLFLSGWNRFPSLWFHLHCEVEIVSIKESGSEGEVSDFPPPTSSALHSFRPHGSRRGGRLRSEGAEESVTEGRCSLVGFDEDCKDATRAELSEHRDFFLFSSLFTREAERCRSGSCSLSKAAVTRPEKSRRRSNTITNNKDNNNNSPSS